MVDTRDLKSLGQQCPCGFDSRPRHKEGWLSPSLLVLYPSHFCDFSLLQKNEEDGHDEAEECGDVIPVKGLALEKDGHDDREDNKRDNLLNHF